MMHRRSFLKAILAAAAAPAYIKSQAGVLMPASSASLVPGMCLDFDAGPRSIFPGDALNITTSLIDGTVIATSFEAFGAGVCGGCRVFLDSEAPRVVPLGGAQFIQRSQNIYGWERYYMAVERHLSNA